jgi:hypothetical protein
MPIFMGTNSSFVMCFLIQFSFFQIGLVIDLTNTTRYYSPAEWMKQGTKHVKVRVLSLNASLFFSALFIY